MPPTTRHRRPRRTRTEVEAAVRELSAMGLMRAEIAHRLGMTDGAHGSLARALQRAGQHALLARITPPDWWVTKHRLAGMGHGADGRWRAAA